MFLIFMLLWIYSFIQLKNILAFISSNIFFMSLSLLWDSSYTCIVPRSIFQELPDALFIFDILFSLHETFD